MERGDAIVLIGFMGAGKTTVGRELARLTAWPLYETDVIIEARFGCSTAEIFAAHGEAAFRAAETAALAEMPAGRAIVATGGGVVLRAENREMLTRLGVVIYLEADAVTLFARVANERETRPLLDTADSQTSLSVLLREREPLYRAAADLIVHTSGRRVAEVAQTIFQHVG